MNDVVTYLYMTVVTLYIHVYITVGSYLYLMLFKVHEKLTFEDRDKAKKTRTEITDDKV